MFAVQYNDHDMYMFVQPTKYMLRYMLINNDVIFVQII